MLDWNIIIVAALAALPGTLLGIATLYQGRKTHLTFNSKMDAMLKLTEKSSFAEGVKAEKENPSVKII